MADWTKSMQQTFEFYVVDPTTWKDTTKLDTVKSATLKRDSSAETLGSATFDMTGDISECYVRVYLVTIQNGVKERHPLGTYLVETPSSSHNGKLKTISVDAYTPLLELKEKQPPIGYYIPKLTNILDKAAMLTQEHMRAPVIPSKSESVLDDTNFVADIKDTWLTYLSSLISHNSKDEPKFIFDIDPLGQVMFAPVQKTEALQPVWTFNDDNSSILYPDIDLDHDIYGIPNVVEVVYSTAGKYYHGRAVNDDPNSPTSTVNRGREITHRVTEPELVGDVSEERVNEYAAELLKKMSTVEYTVSYTHGYCPVRLNDCVMLNYTRAGYKNVKAKVISQSIKCEPGCPVTEKAVFTTKLWR